MSRSACAIADNSESVNARFIVLFLCDSVTPAMISLYIYSLISVCFISCIISDYNADGLSVQLRISYTLLYIKLLHISIIGSV